MKNLFHDSLTRSTLVVLAGTALAIACLPKEDDDDDGGDSGGYYSYGYSSSGQRMEAPGFGPEDVAVSLTREGLVVRLLEPTPGLTMGLAQTGDCDGDCWVAESCTADAIGGAVCHDLSEDGVVLLPVSATDQVLPSHTTRVTPGQQGFLTFMLDDGAQCYTWGHDPTFYAERYGCSVW